MPGVWPAPPVPPDDGRAEATTKARSRDLAGSTPRNPKATTGSGLSLQPSSRGSPQSNNGSISRWVCGRPAPYRDRPRTATGPRVDRSPKAAYSTRLTRPIDPSATGPVLIPTRTAKPSTPQPRATSDAVPGDGQQNVQRRPRGPLGVILVRDRSPEERQHPVARKVLHIATEPLDLGHDPTDRLAHNELDLFILETLSQLSGPSEISEQRRDARCSSRIRPSPSRTGRLSRCTGEETVARTPRTVRRGAAFAYCLLMAT